VSGEPTEGAERAATGDTVDDQPPPPLKATDGRPRLGPEDSVDASGESTTVAKRDLKSCDVSRPCAGESRTGERHESADQNESAEAFS
jgi:hypothetical protein